MSNEEQKPFEVYQGADGWYWNDTLYHYGPYVTQESAMNAMRNYQNQCGACDD